MDTKRRLIRFSVINMVSGINMKTFRLLAVTLSLIIAPAASAQPGQTAAQTHHLDVLSDSDSAKYREIFSLQERGRWNQADKEIAALDDDILMGYVLFQRYMHPTAYRSKYRELKKWMAYYADHPEADKIYALAMKRRPKRQTSPVRPIPRQWRSAPATDMHPGLASDYETTSGPRLRQIEGRVRFLSKKERAVQALKEIENHHRQKTITQRQYDRMRSWIAASLYYQGYVNTAKDIAAQVATRNGESAVLAYWISGLIAFREDDSASAYQWFNAMASVPYQEDSLRSAAGFWAARAALADGQVGDVAPNLEIAAQFPFTFYGQLALAQLGRDYEFDWRSPVMTADGFAKLVAAAPRVKRAAALAQAGRAIAADVELRWANGSIPGALDYDLLAVANSLDLPAAQIDIALAGDGKYLQSGLFPVPGYKPHGGFKTDRALIYALMRQESKFKVEATSRAGARGLMQLMPRTASYIAKDRDLQRGKGRDRLYDPGFNLQLGQRYVNYLIEKSARGDLFHLAAAYNGGPGNLRRWKNEIEIEDPLLFIESIPNPESRDFVEKVLTNVWVYRARLGQAAPTRDKVAAGQLPLYEALDQIAAD